MDDIRLWCHSIRLGWRWFEGDLIYRGDWREEERASGMTGLEKTIQIIQAIMNEICNFLTLTMESCMDFPDWKLPILDLNIWVNEDNITLWSFFSKPMACNYVIQKVSAMPENVKIIFTI